MAEGDIDVDALLSSIEAPSGERAMTGPAEPEEAAPPAAPEPPAWDAKPWEFEWNGKKIAPESQDKAKIWMSQGYNYSQRMGELNKTHAQKVAEAEAAQKAAKDAEARYSPFAKVDEYAKKNPDWWKHTLTAYEEAQSSRGPVDPRFEEAIRPLQEKVGQFEQFLAAKQQEEAAAAATKEDEALEAEVQTIRKEFPNIDLTTVDPQSGLTLEKRILNRCAEIGTGSFKVGFRDYLHDKLIEQAKAEGRGAIAKEAQLNAKKGILGKSPTPIKSGLKPVEGRVRWNDPQLDGANILKEMGL